MSMHTNTNANLVHRSSPRACWWRDLHIAYGDLDFDAEYDYDYIYDDPDCLWFYVTGQSTYSLEAVEHAKPLVALFSMFLELRGVPSYVDEAAWVFDALVDQATEFLALAGAALDEPQLTASALAALWAYTPT